MTAPSDSADRSAPYFVLTLGLTWLLQLPALLVHLGLLAGPLERFLPLLGLSALAPLLVATFLSRRAPGGVRGLYRGLGAWRVNPLWFVVALGLSGALLAAGKAGYLLWGGKSGGAWFYPPLGPERWIALVIFSLGEEVGWRGYALPRLLRRYGPLTSSLLLGLAWGVWHIPMFLITGIDPLLLVVLVLVFLPAGSITFTWVFQHTGGSLLLAVLMHMGAHLSNPHQLLPQQTTPAWLQTAAYVVFALLLVALDSKLRGPAPARSSVTPAAGA